MLWNTNVTATVLFYAATDPTLGVPGTSIALDAGLKSKVWSSKVDKQLIPTKALIFFLILVEKSSFGVLYGLAPNAFEWRRRLCGGGERVPQCGGG